MVGEILDDERDWTRCAKKQEVPEVHVQTRSREQLIQRYVGIALVVGGLAFLIQLLIRFL